MAHKMKKILSKVFLFLISCSLSIGSLSLARESATTHKWSNDVSNTLIHPLNKNPVIDIFNIDASPNGYLISLQLRNPLPLRSGVPGLAADGVFVGNLSPTDKNGKMWTIFTSNKKVVTAKSASIVWDAEIPPKDARLSSDLTYNLKSFLSKKDSPRLAEDPGEKGPFQVQQIEYDLGDKAMPIDIAWLPNGKFYSEIRGQIYLPDARATGPLPVVLFLHGMHDGCGIPPWGLPVGESYTPDRDEFCVSSQREIPNFLGYGLQGQLLASQGFIVVSVSVNRINLYTQGSSKDEYGNPLRGKLLLATLDLLKKANKGETNLRIPNVLKGRIDLQRVGLMGHSRGGDGIVNAAIQNNEREHPFGIKSLLAIAPPRNSREIPPANAAFAVLLPYCDGDVRSLGGQQFFDQALHGNSEDSALRVSTLMMGANHNYFNSVWTPGTVHDPEAEDDWNLMFSQPNLVQSNKFCGPLGSERLSAEEQNQAGATYLSAFFRLTLRNEVQFLPMFNGENGVAPSMGRSQWRTTAQMPTKSRVDLITFDERQSGIVPKNEIFLEGFSESQLCRGLKPANDIPSIEPSGGESVLPVCTDQLDLTQAPHWAKTISTFPTMKKLVWKNKNAVFRFKIPEKVKVSEYVWLTFRASPLGGAEKASDMIITIIDRHGNQHTITDLSDAFSPLPGGHRWPLGKTLLRQVTVFLHNLPKISVDEISEITLTPKTEEGGIYLSDFAFSRYENLLIEHEYIYLAYRKVLPREEFLRLIGAPLDVSIKLTQNEYEGLYLHPGRHKVRLCTKTGSCKYVIAEVLKDWIPPIRLRTKWSQTIEFKEGDIVIWRDVMYRANWSSRGEHPDESDAWEPADKNYIQHWNAIKSYKKDTVVWYDGKQYRAKWWTRGEKPGVAQAWKIDPLH